MRRCPWLQRRKTLNLFRSLLLSTCSLVAFAAGVLWIAYLLPFLASDLSGHKFVLTGHPLPRSTVRLDKKVPKLKFMVNTPRHTELLSQYEWDSHMPGHPPRIEKPFEGKYRIFGITVEVWDAASVRRLPQHSTYFTCGAFPYWKKFQSTVFLDIPLWLVLFVFGAYPALALSKHIIRRRSRKRDHCLKCGYNLAGNTSGVCPECGRGCRNRSQ